MPRHFNTACPGKQSVADDDEIIAGEQKMSLKCPVSPIGIDPKTERSHPVGTSS